MAWYYQGISLITSTAVAFNWTQKRALKALGMLRSNALDNSWIQARTRTEMPGCRPNSIIF